MATVGVLDVEWHQGDTFDKLLTWKNENLDPVPLDGYTARMQLRTSADSDEVVLQLTTENGRIQLENNIVLEEDIGDLTGKIRLIVDAVTMADVPAATYRYDLEMVSDGYVRKLVKGKFKVIAEVTKALVEEV